MHYPSEIKLLLSVNRMASGLSSRVSPRSGQLEKHLSVIFLTVIVQVSFLVSKKVASCRVLTVSKVTLGFSQRSPWY